MPRELGFLDYPGAGGSTAVLDTTGSVVLLNVVPQGAGVSERVGKKIAMKSMQMRATMKANSAAVATKVAFIIVYDKRPTGALPAVTDILVAVDPHSMANDANVGRFKILKRCEAVLHGNENAVGNVTDTSSVDASFFLSLRDATTVYKAAGTGAIGDIEEGALYLVTLGDKAAGTSAGTLTYNNRLRFLDT